ncbi:MAG: hypothetical protein ACXW3X_16995 [Rhodoplanes sp.]
MLVSTVIKVVSACVRWRKAVIAFYLTVGAASAYYAATHFRIDTNMDRLMSPTLDWRVAEKDFEQSFPGRFYSILVHRFRGSGHMVGIHLHCDGLYAE